MLREGWKEKMKKLSNIDLYKKRYKKRSNLYMFEF